jgi:hypothetical protein
LINGSGGNPPHPVIRFALPFTSGFEFDVFPAWAPPGSGPDLSNGGTQYFVSSQFVQNIEHQLAVWALTNTSSLETSHPALSLSAVAVDTQTYQYPNAPATQKGGFRPLGFMLNEPLEKLNPDDFRIISAEYVGGRIWATLNTQVIEGAAKRVGGAYFALVPKVQGQFITATVFTQGIIAQPGANLLYSAVAINSSQRGAIVFTLSGPSNYPSSAFAAVQGTSVGPIIIARDGNEPEDGFSGYVAFGGNGIARWGDYSAGAINDVDNSIWLATEYVPDIARSSLANWCTYITRVQP